MKLRIMALLTAAVFAAAGSSPGAVTVQAIPYANTFETYATGMAMTNLSSEGWDASTNSVAIETNVVWTNNVWPNTNAVVIPAAAVLTHAVTNLAVLTNVWADCELQMVQDQNEMPAVDSNAVIQICLDSNGFVRVYDLNAGGWAQLTNNVLGSTVNALATGQWARVSINQNYLTRQCAVFLDGVPLRDQLPFVSNVTRCTQFRLDGDQFAPTYFDNYGITLAVPPRLTGDINGDGMPDVQEIQAHGYVAKTLAVGTGQPYATIQAAVNAARAWDVITVASGTYTEDVTVASAVGGLTGQVFALNGTLSVGSGVALVSRIGFTGGGVAVAAGGSFAVIGNLSANTVTGDVGSTVSVSGSLSASNVTISSGATLTAAGGITATNLTLGANVTVNLTNANVVATHLAMSPGARLVVTNGMLVADGLTLSGSFTVGDTWGTLAQSSLPFTDDFENYTVGTPVSALGFRGWGASDNAILVESNATYGGSGRAIALIDNQSVSNRVATSGPTNVWTDLQGVWAYAPSDSLPDVDSNAVAAVFVNSNGYMTVRNGGVWDVCSNSVYTGPVNPIGQGQWNHVSIQNNFITKRSAVFLNERLLRQGVPFVNSNAARYSTFQFSSIQSNAAYLDNVAIQAEVPASLTGVGDALCIQAYGQAFRGVIFETR